MHHRIIASSHHRHDAGAPSVDACRTRSADTRSILRVCLRNSCPRALGILSTVIVVVVMEDEVLFLRWLLLYHLRLIEECDVEVLVAPSFRCDARAFPPLCRHAEPMRRSAASHGASSNVLVHVHDAGWVHVVLRHIVHQAQSAKNCMACCLMLCCKVLYHSFRGAFHDELGQDGACHGHGRRKHLAVHGLSFLFSSSHRRSVRDHPVVPSKQVAQQCLERGHPVAQGLCVLLVRGWLPDASLLQGWPPIRLQLGCRIVPSKHLVAVATFKREH